MISYKSKKLAFGIFFLMNVWWTNSNVSAQSTGKEEVLDIIHLVNSKWQKNNPVHGRAFWDNAAYHTGNMEVYLLTGEEKYREYSTQWAEHNQWKGAKSNEKANWKYGYGETDDYVLFGDYQICFQVYADLYNLDPEEKKIARAIEVMEYQMSTPQNDYWWWADGLYMVMPVMTRLYNITGNPLYLDKLYEYYTYANDIMYDPQEQLYYRDGKYIYPNHTSTNGKKDFWARGDGWVFAGLAKVLKELPQNDAHRDEYLQRYKELAAAIIACQQPEGYWTRSMLDPGHAPGPETSGTAFFTYGLFWGINNGHLSSDVYLHAAMKAWQYLSGFALQEGGQVGYIQPIGEKAIPGQVINARSTTNFGVGAFLLAACEYYRYLDTSSLLRAQENYLFPANLTCEFQKNPLGVDVAQPMLGWTLHSSSPEVRNTFQTAYQILVATSLELLHKDEADIWNSGKVHSDRMGQITYAGTPLRSGKKYWWKVRIWDQTGKESLWSPPARWTTGLFHQNEWQAQWITAEGADKYALNYQSARRDFRIARDYAEAQPNAPREGDPNFSSLLLRHEFEVGTGLKRALIYICGLGHYEISLNGGKVGDLLLAPGWSDYEKTVLYDTYDITARLQEGMNAVGIMLGNGMYNIQPDSVRYVKFLNTYGPLKAIAQIQLEYADGSIRRIGTNKEWSVSPGPVTYSNLFGGEDVDARLIQQGWDEPFFDKAANWFPALECEGPGGQLRGLSCAAPPVKSIEILEPVTINSIRPGVLVYDMGQNASIMPEIKIEGPRGSRIRMIPSELLFPDGTVDRASATQDGVRPAWWEYTKSTDETESWFPHFFYQGARYVQVELFPGEKNTTLPEVKELKAHVVHTSAEPIGTFSCSNELFNRICHLVRWAQRSNLVSIITDCPQREKLGWLEQYHLNGPSLRYNYELSSLFRKGMNDMADSQLENGFVPNIAPEFFLAHTERITDGFRNSPEWGSSFIIVPWQQYLFSGDISLIQRYYEPMKNYVAFLDSISRDNILHYGLGDWYDIGPNDSWGSQLTPVPVTATAIFYYDCKLMAEMANLLDRPEDVEFYQQKAEIIRQAFNKEFFNIETKTYATNSQTANAMPLFMGIVEPQYREAVARAIVEDIRGRGNALTSGDVGYRFLLKALAMEGYSDVIFDMNNQTDKPGYGYQLKMGATSLTEKWDAGVGIFGSQNHFMLGQINEWFFHDLAGIQPDPAGPGFRRICIKPTITGDITWVRASYKTVSGLIKVEWKLDDNKWTLQVTVPDNTTAQVCLPTDAIEDVSESKQPLAIHNDILSVKSEGGHIVCEVGSGIYIFEVLSRNLKR